MTETPDSAGSHRKDVDDRREALMLACMTYRNDQVLEQRTEFILKRAETFLRYIKEGKSP